MNLPQRPLGSSRVSITATGFGASAVGGGGWAFSWGSQNDAVSLATVRHALELGINWIDTAAVYGLCHSEQVVGRLLRESPESERPLVFTKCGLIWDENDPMAAPRRVLWKILMLTRLVIPGYVLYASYLYWICHPALTC